MIYFLYGPDTYRSREKLKEIISKYKKIHTSGLAFSRLDMEEDGFEEWKKRAMVAPLFPEKKLLVVERLGANKEAQKQFEHFFEKNSPQEDRNTITVFFEETTPKSTDPFFKLLKRISETQEFEAPKGIGRRQWVARYLGGKNKAMSPRAFVMFLSSTGSLDTWGLKNELDKLVYFSDENIITEEDVTAHMKPDVHTIIFDVLDALGAKNKKQALALLEGLLEQGEKEPYILSMIAYGIRSIIQVKAILEEERVPYHEIRRELRLNPLVIRKSYLQAKHFTLVELKKIYRNIIETDLDMKVGEVEPRVALELLVSDITSSREERTPY